MKEHISPYFTEDISAIQLCNDDDPIEIVGINTAADEIIKIADKMVSERMREYHLNEGYDVVIVGNPDKEIDGDIFEDIKVAALELGELRGLKVMITGFYANYIKRRK